MVVRLALVEERDPLIIAHWPRSAVFVGWGLRFLASRPRPGGSVKRDISGRLNTVAFARAVLAHFAAAKERGLLIITHWPRSAVFVGWGLRFLASRPRPGGSVKRDTGGTLDTAAFAWVVVVRLALAK